MKYLKNSYKSPYSYYMGAKGERLITTIKGGIPTCRFCKKEFNNGDTAYFADVERFIVCYECLQYPWEAEFNTEHNSCMSSTHDEPINTVFLFGEIKINDGEVKR